MPIFALRVKPYQSNIPFLHQYVHIEGTKPLIGKLKNPGVVFPPPILLSVYPAESFRSSTVLTSRTFESMIPDLTKQFQRACRYMNPVDREEAVQDMMATAFAGYKSFVDRNLYDNIYRSTLGRCAIRSYRGGRRFYGNRSKDVMDPLCQMQGRADVRGHVFYDSGSHQWIEVLIYDRTHDLALIGEFNIDYENWRKTLSDKQRDLLDDFLLNEATGDIARKNNLSPGRISQIRRELLESFNAFVGNVETPVS